MQRELSLPGYYEENGIGDSGVYMRDRHTIVDTEGLERILDDYVTIKSPEDYTKRFVFGPPPDKTMYSTAHRAGMAVVATGDKVKMGKLALVKPGKQRPK